MDAVDHILDQQSDLKSITVTAHPAAGQVDLSQNDLSTLVALAEDIRCCQD
jgi:hypothetical protein